MAVVTLDPASQAGAPVVIYGTRKLGARMAKRNFSDEPRFCLRYHDGRTVDFTPGSDGLTTTGQEEVLHGPITFVGARFDFSIKSTEVFGGSGWLTVAIVRTSNARQGGLESFSERDIIAFRTWSIGEVPNKSFGTSYFVSDKPLCLRTRNRKRVAANEGVHIWVKVEGPFEKKINIQGDVVVYYHS